MSQAVQAQGASHPKRCPKCGDAYRGDALFCPDCGSALVLAHDAEDAHGKGTADPYVGTEILGHIEIQKLAGIGAMGRVYRAHQKGVDRDVAVKILRKEISGNEQLASRFTREAKVASRLSHPHVVQVYLAGQLPDGSMYIVMEFLDGLSLHSVLAASGGEPLSLERTLHIAVQLCDAVGEAHSHDVVHRDIKPENVMLVQRAGDANFVKVLDFGIARLRASDQSVSTAAGLIFGTARYISPEGAQGMGVTPASDVYSLATVFYQLLTGHTPFENEQPVQLLLQHVHEPPPPMRAFVGDSLPSPIVDAIMKNLSKDPAKRDPDGRAFGRALVEAAHASGIVPQAVARDSWSSRISVIQSSPHAPRRDSTPPTSDPGRGVTEIAETESVRSAAIESGAAEKHAARTTKWTPSSELSLRLSPTPAPAEVRLDETLDDDDLQHAPVLRSAPARTTFQTPLPAQVHGPGEPSSLDARTDVPERRSGAALAIFGACVIAIAAVFLALFYFRGNASGSSATTDTSQSPPSETRRSEPTSHPSADPPLSGLRPMTPTSHVVVPSASSSATSRARVVIGKTPQSPAIGQSVQFTANIIGVDVKNVSGAHFLVQGPGINTKLPAALEGGAFRAALTFFEPGSFTVIFRAAADARDISGSMGLSVGGQDRPVDPPPLPHPSGAPAPPGTVKWL